MPAVPVLIAATNCCEEASPKSSEFYIPCNKPATTMIFSPRDQATYRMCAMCASHSIKNRGMQDMGPYEPVDHVDEGAIIALQSLGISPNVKEDEVLAMADDDVFAMAEDDADEEKPVTEDKLAAITKLANLQVQLEHEVSVLDNTIKDVKEKLRKVAEQDLPEALDAVGMTEFKLSSGFKIAVTPFYNASIPAERKDEAFTWFDQHGHGGMIKSDVVFSFSRGEIDFAKEFLKWVNTQYDNLDSEFKQSIHWQTLRAFVKEQVESGAALPIDLLGVFVGRKAKITQVK